MKIAVTYDNGEIFQHFGKTESFKIYEVEDNKVVSSEVIGSNGTGHGALAGLLAEQGVNVLICGGIGGGAQTALTEAGIDLCAGVQGNVDEVVETYLKGELESSGVNCDHHHHEDEHAHVHHHGHHAHTSVASILEKISVLDMSDTVKKDAEGIYREIAAAESKVHQTDMEQIHFHEVGSVDALIDVVGSCLALELLGVDEVQASPVCVGNGTVRCAHGILPVPAPATAEIIKGMPVYCSSFDGELLTPTGAAILKYFVESYTKEMHMEIEEIGYGFGTKDFAQLSCVRAFLGYQK